MGRLALVGAVALALTACSGNVNGPEATPSRARQEMTACPGPDEEPVKTDPKLVVSGQTSYACPVIMIKR